MKRILLVSLCAMILVFGAVSLLQAATVVDLLVNGDFDAGSGTPWVETSSASSGIIDAWTTPFLPDSGTHYAKLGGFVNEIDNVYQDVVIPAATTHLSLTYSVFVWSTNEPGDGLSLGLVRLGSQTPELLGSFSSTESMLWTEYSVDVSGDYAGDTVSLWFTSRTTGLPFVPTEFGIDTVSLNATVPIPGAVWLLGSGLIGIVGIRRKFRS